MDVGTFQITRVIIHEIPKAKIVDKAVSAPSLSDAVTSLDADQRNYFENRIRTSISKAFAVEWDGGDSGSPVPGAIMSCFDDANYDEAAFIEQSKMIATHLHQKQGGGSPAGLVAVVEATVATGDVHGRCIVVLKLELESGVSVTSVTDGQGRTSLAVKIEDFTLTETTRVFKAGLFPRFGSLDELSGWVSDAQLDSATAGRVVADFFLNDFLGCKLKDTAEVGTLHFVNLAREFAKAIDDPDTQFRYITAIRAEVESNSPTIDPEAFANEFLDVHHRDNFVNRFMTADGAVPPIMKDVQLVRREISRTWVTFTDGVRVTGPPGEVEKYVDVIREATDEDGTRKIHSEIKNVR